MMNGNAVEDFVCNWLMDRASLAAASTDPHRNLSRDCGYPEGYIQPLYYQMLFDRDPIAARVVQLMPLESWTSYPSITEDRDENKTTAFEDAFREVCRGLNGQDDYGGIDDDSNPVWAALETTDILSGIGEYGILLLGLDDGADLSEPADLGKSRTRKLLYLTPLPQSMVQVVGLEEDRASPRFSLPTYYSITWTRESAAGGYELLPETSMQVHWSRVLHVADNVGSSRVYGRPRMQPVLNRLLDLRKIYGSSAEGYWQGSFPGIAFKTQPKATNPKVDAAGLQEMMSEYMSGMRRWIALRNLDVSTITPVVSDPASQVNVQLQAICIELGVPQRVFMGSERGELASTQDADAWARRVAKRRCVHNAGAIIRPFVNRLIALGVLPKPSQFYVDWPDLTSPSAQEKAALALQQTQAVETYAAIASRGVLAPIDYWTRIMGLSQADAESVIENAGPIQPPPAPPPPFGGPPPPADGADVANVFCATGPGGGIDPHCSPRGGGASAGEPGGGAGGRANAFDEVLKRSGTHPNQTLREFYRAVHPDLRTTRPASDQRFHDPLRLKVEAQLHELAGPHAEALYRAGHAGLTQIAFKGHQVDVSLESPGRVHVSSIKGHGPNPRDPLSFVITHDTPPAEVAYRLHKAAGLKTDPAEKEKYMAADKAARAEFRARQRAARETRRAQRIQRRTSGG